MSALSDLMLAGMAALTGAMVGIVMCAGVILLCAVMGL